uniref:Uncharacterized protein n=1 Tax=Panagrolaimus davidi TaxID=227884 RepID=A0A914QU73_9BILA
MVVGSYLITSIHMRISDGIGSSKYIGPNDSPVLQGPLTPVAVRERCERVFKMVPKKMKNLVLVNSALSTFDFIQACVEVADKYSDKVMVIPPLLALLTFALDEIAKFRNPPDKEIILVVTITPGFVDFVILRRDSNFILYIAEFEHFEIKLNEYKERFAEFYNFSYPHSTILLVHDTVHNIAEEIRYEFNPENCFISTFKQWHYILLYGGMLRAMDEEDGFDTRYHIANFSNGYETTIQNHRTRTRERHILLHPRSSLPCNISLQQNIPPMLINVFYSPEYYQLGNELVPTKKAVTKQAVYSSGTLNEIIGYIDERGIPFVKDSAAFMNRELPKNTIAEKQTPRKQDSNENNQISRASETTILSQPSSSSVSDSPQIKFIFHKNLCAIEVVQHGSSKFLTDSFGK